MRKFLGWVAGIAITGVVLAGLTVFGLWWFDWRYRPQTITRHQDEIAQALDRSGWVSPHLTGPKLYMLSFRACPECIRYETEQFPKLQAAGVDTRVILVTLPDKNGQSLSTAPERATVAELWINRSWRLFQQWTSVTPAAWTAPGVPPADGDAARTAVVQAGHSLVDTLTPLLRDNGLQLGYPTLVWWTRDSEMHACVCASPQSYERVAKELGVTPAR